MANQRPPNQGGSRRRYTPEERRAMEQRRRAELERRRNGNNALIAVIVVCAVVIASICIWQFGFVRPNDNYDAQMRIGVENFNLKQYGKAEEAFLNALTKRPNDPEAMIALSDTYAAQERYDEAILEMRALQGIDDTDARTYERLITWYVEGVKDMASANKQITSAYEKQLPLSSALIQPAPVFDPQPGDYGEATNISITASKGLTIYYSTDGSVPTIDNGKEYTKEISLKNNKNVTYTAVAYDEYGLMTWPASAKYSLAIKYDVDAPAAQYIGETAKAIMNSVGPLYYDSQHEGGYYYYDDSKECYYVFSGEYFTIESVMTDGAVQTSEINPEDDPLPVDSVCVAVSMKVSDYVVQMEGDINADDLMAGIGVEDYGFEKDVQDGKYHLIYEVDGARYDMALKGKDTVTGKGVLMIYAP